MVKRYGSNGFEPGTIEVECGDLVHYDDYSALLSENERLKSEAGYTAADVATAAADGYRDGVRSFNMERLREVFCQVLQDEFDLEAADPEDHRHDDGRGEALRVSDRLLALIDAHKGE